MMTVDVWNPSSPVSVKQRFNRQGTTTFIAVKLKIPSVASSIRIYVNVSLVGDFEGRIVVQLIKKAILKQKRKCEKKNAGKL